MNIALILAAGKGTRMGGPVPKQFMDYKDKPILVYTLEAFAKQSEIDEICVICPEDSIHFTNQIIENYHIPKIGWVAAGGATRRESSKIGILKLSETHCDTDIVLIHDGARPNVSARIILENIHAAQEKGACETVVRCHDTIAISEDACKISSIPDREVLFTVQTPQTFRLDLIRSAHIAFDEPIKPAKSDGGICAAITDDAALILRAGGDVFLVEGDKLNIKITTQEDLRILYNIMK